MWLTNWSAIRVMKSPNMISSTGRNPRSANPAATPASPASEMGVVITCCGNGVEQPRRHFESPAVRIKDILAKQEHRVIDPRAFNNPALSESSTVRLMRCFLRKPGRGISQRRSKASLHFLFHLLCDNVLNFIGRQPLFRNLQRIAFLFQLSKLCLRAGIIPFGMGTKTRGIQDQSPRGDILVNFRIKLRSFSCNFQHITGIQLNCRNAKASKRFVMLPASAISDGVVWAM